MIESIGTYLPCWGTAVRRVVGDDEDAVTMAVAAGRQALKAVDASQIHTVAIVSRELPLLEGGNGAALLAGLGLSAATALREELGGAPAALEAASVAPPGTLVVAADVEGGAGAAAIVTGDRGCALTALGRSNRSLPVVTRDARGVVTNYADQRLLRELGRGVSLERLDLSGAVDAVAGLEAKDAAPLGVPGAPALPTLGASSSLFALAAIAEGGRAGRILAVEQATVALVEMQAGSVTVARDEATPSSPPKVRAASEAEIAISLAAYSRAFDAKLRLEAEQCATCGTLAYPHRFRCLGCGSEEAGHTVPLPREAEIYSLATIHVAVPGLATPYTVVLAEMGDTGVRVLARLTGAVAGSVAIGDRGAMVLRRVAVRMGVPDYGYAFLPARRVEVAS